MTSRNGKIREISQIIKKEDSVLDVGCVGKKNAYLDQSWLHQHLCSASNDVIGIDINNDEIIELNKVGYNIRYGDAENFSLNKKVDVIVAGDIIEHLSNPGLFLICAKSHLRSNGKLIITVPNVWYILSWIQAFFHVPSVHPQHTMWFDERTLTQLLIRNTFNIKKIKYLPPDKTQRGQIVCKLLEYIGIRIISAPTILIVATPGKN